MIQVELRDILSPQHVRCMVRNRIAGERKTPVMANQIMDIYTGLIGIRTPREDPLVRHDVETLVPLGLGSSGNMPVQVYRDPGGDPDSPLTEAIAMVTLSSFAYPPQVAGVDNISVEIRPIQFQGVSGTFHFLILKATVACQQTNIHGLAYQVTVLTTPVNQDATSTKAFDELEAALRLEDRLHTPASLAAS